MTTQPICLECRHFHKDSKDGPYHCDAFPEGDGIPEAILLSEHDHHEPFPGDNGIVFEPIAKKDSA